MARPQDGGGPPQRSVRQPGRAARPGDRSAGERPRAAAARAPGEKTPEVGGRPQAANGGKRIIVAAALVLLVLAGVVVSRALSGGSGASKAYAEASALWQQTGVEAGDEAPVDPRADRVLELLKNVPADSIDADAAAALAKHIRDERQAYQRRKELARAPEQLIPPGAPVRAALGATAAAAAPTRSPVVVTGDPVSRLTELYGKCVRAIEPFVEKGGNRRGMAWGLVDSKECRASHPDLDGMLVFVAEDRVFNVARAAEVQRRAPAADAGTAPPPKAAAEPEGEPAAGAPQ